MEQVTQDNHRDKKNQASLKKMDRSDTTIIFVGQTGCKKSSKTVIKRGQKGHLCHTTRELGPNPSAWNKIHIHNPTRHYGSLVQPQVNVEIL